MKKIVIISSMTADGCKGFEDQLKMNLDKDQYMIESFPVGEMKINYCSGCWSCWLKTPGLCAQKDEMPAILKSVINADLALLVSPVKMGFVSADIKKVTDKMIPLVHPYITIYKGECHHVKRYDHFPKLGLILLGDKTQNQPSKAIIDRIYERVAINMRSQLAFSVLTDGDVKEAAYEISHI